MTSLPISIPAGFTIVVKKGDKINLGQVLATASDHKVSHTRATTSQTSGRELIIDFSEALNQPGDTGRKYLLKGPGDSVKKGDLLAVKKKGFKKEEIRSEIDGIIVRFERDTGKLVLQTADGQALDTESTARERKDITSPLAGEVTLCDNEKIVIETDSKTLVGSEGRGGTGQGKIIVLTPDDDQKMVSGTQITKDTIGKILLLPDIDKEAVAKAAAIGVAGILATKPSEELFSYMESRKIELP
ncbi:MAG TPA: hypothetical protein VG935_04825, partial [Patescibacteria group bacterium]|nr:hypothetical protein [Patescibacteria group bacterium]